MAFDLGEFVLLVIAILILHKFGDAAAMEHYTGGSAHRSLGTAAFVLIVVSDFWMGRVTDTPALCGAVIRGLIAASLVSGFAKLLLPSAVWFWQFFRVPLRRLKTSRLVTSNYVSNTVPVTTAPPASVAPTTGRKSSSEGDTEERELSARRRVAARFECQMLYDQYSHEIHQRFSQERLLDYFTRFMGDDQPIEEIERRAGKLQQMIVAFAEASPSTDAAFRSVSDIREHFQREREVITSAEFDRHEEDSLLKQLAIEESRTLREFRQT